MLLACVGLALLVPFGYLCCSCFPLGVLLCLLLPLLFMLFFPLAQRRGLRNCTGVARVALLHRHALKRVNIATRSGATRKVAWATGEAHWVHCISAVHRHNGSREANNVVLRLHGGTEFVTEHGHPSKRHDAKSVSA